MAGSGNPFIDAINSIPIGTDSTVNNIGQSYANLPTFSPNIPNFSSTGVSVPTSLAGFGSSSSKTSSGAPKLPAALQATSSQTASQQYSHPMGNFGADIGNVWSHLSGALQGAQLGAGNALRNTKLGYNNRFTMETGGMIPQQKPVSKAQEGGYTNVFSGLLKGVENPTATHAKFKQGEQQFTPLTGASPGVNAFLKGLRNFGLDTATDPLTYVPFGKVAKVIGLTKAAKLGANAVKATSGGRKVANALNYVFKPVAGARPEFVNGIGRMEGRIQSDALANSNALENAFRGTTPTQRTALTYALEPTATKTKFTSPFLQRISQALEPLMEDKKNLALDTGLIKGAINPSEYGVGRYISHVPVGKLDENLQPFSDISRRSANIDAGKARTLAGTIRSINAQGGPQFETDLAKILGYHFNQVSKAAAIRDFIKESMDRGIETGGNIHAGDVFPGTVQKAVEYSHDGRTVLLPESEAKYLKGIAESGLEGAKTISKGYKTAVNWLNRSMFLSNPFIHPVNNLGTQTLLHAPSVFLRMPKYLINRNGWKFSPGEAFKGITPGSKMDEALKAGALHLTSEIGHTTNPSKLANQLTKSIDRAAQDASRNRVEKTIANAPKTLWNAYNRLTPNLEKAFRAGAFEKATEQGKSPDEAANWIRSIYGGNAAHDSASTFEKTMRGFMPFYNWTKTAIGSNVKNFLHHPAPYVAGYHALDNYNQAVTGHPMSQNHNPLSIGLPWKDKNGNQEYWTLYAPPFDVAKLVKDMKQNGVLSGAADFGLSRANPLVKYIAQMSTHEQNPFARPQNKFNVDPNPYANSQNLPGVPQSIINQMHERGILFGDKGWKAPAGIAQFLQDFNNPISDAMQVGTEDSRGAWLSKLLGGSISAPNPQSAVKQQNYQSSEALRELKSFLKKLNQQNQGG